LVAVEIDKRQTRIVIAMNGQLFLVLCLNDAHDVFEELMNIDRLFFWWATRSQKSVNKTGKSVCFADNDIRVLTQLGVVELALQQLRGTTNAAERVLNFVCKLSNHLSTCAMLYQQRVFTADLVAARYIGHFYEQGGSVDFNW